MNIMDLKPAEYNPRTISDDQLERLKKSLEEFGDLSGIVFNRQTGNLVGGHQRLKVIPEGADIDKTELKEVSKAIKSAFDNENIPDEDFNVDKAIQDAVEPKTKLGDIYILGNYRLLCGDAANKDHVERLMNGKTANMVFTDPPYGLKYDGKTSGNSENNKGMWNVFVGDDLAGNEWIQYISKILINIPAHDADWYICIDWRAYPNLIHCLPENFKIWNCIVWYKNHIGLGKKYRYTHEFIIYGSQAEPKLNTSSESDVWEIAREKTIDYEHPTQKPVDLPVRAIMNSSRHNDIVVDFFMGSGTTLIACEQTQRICYGMELDPHYCDVIVRRWEEYTGKKAELI